MKRMSGGSGKSGVYSLFLNEWTLAERSLKPRPRISIRPTNGSATNMVNCNPETVSTDYDTSDRLYFEPLTCEDVLNIIEREQPDGVVLQFGGQTPLKLALPLSEAGVKVLGTSPDAIDRAEDR